MAASLLMKQRSLLLGRMNTKLEVIEFFLYADWFLTLTTRGPICHSDLCWPNEKEIMI